MKIPSNHCHPATLLRRSPRPHHHATEWQGNIAALRQADKLPSFGKSGNAFDTVAENRFTYGKAKPNEWDFDRSEAGNSKAPVSKAERKDKRESGAHIRSFVPKTLQPCYPIAKQSGGIVSVSQGDRVAKRFRVNKVDPVTKEETSFLVTLVINTISILSYGQIFEFSCSSRSKGTFGDSRVLDTKGKPTRRPLSFAKAELCRILGVTEGMAKFAELTTFPKRNNPATLPPSDPDVKLLVEEFGLTLADAIQHIMEARAALARNPLTATPRNTGTVSQGSNAEQPSQPTFDAQGIRVR